MLPLSGGYIEARRDTLLKPYLADGRIVIPIVGEPPLGAGVVVYNDRVTSWEISVLRDGDIVEDRMEYFDTVVDGSEHLYLFLRRRLA
jgi:hypothetical protein